MYKSKVPIKQLASRLSLYIKQNEEQTNTERSVQSLLDNFFERETPTVQIAINEATNTNTFSASGLPPQNEKDEETDHYGTILEDAEKEEHPEEDEEHDPFDSTPAIEIQNQRRESISGKSHTKPYHEILLECVQQADVARLREYLLEWKSGSIRAKKSLGAYNINAVILGSCTLLHLATKYNHLSIIEFLCSQPDIAIDTFDDIDSTALFYAVANNHEDACALLLSNGAQVNIRDKFMNNPFGLAVKYGYLNIAQLLVLFKANVNMKGKNGNTALMDACEQNRADLVRFLCQKANANPLISNSRDEIPLFAGLSNPLITEDIIEQIRNMIENDKLFFKAVKTKNPQGFSILHKCAQKGYFRTMLSIIEKLPIEVVREMVNEKIPSSECTPLHVAILTKHLDVAQFLFNSVEVDVDVTNKVGDTALHIALKQEQFDLAKKLNVYGQASIRIKNKAGLTSKHLAIRAKFKELRSLDKKHKKVMVVPENWLEEVVNANRYTVLVFFKGLWNNACSQFLQDMNKFVNSFRTVGAEVYGISAQLQTQQNEETKNNMRLGFDLLSNPDLSIPKKFGIPIIESSSATPTSFLAKLFKTKSKEPQAENAVIHPAVVVLDKSMHVLYRVMGQSSNNKGSKNFSALASPKFGPKELPFGITPQQIYLIVHFVTEGKKLLGNYRGELKPLFSTILGIKEGRSLYRDFLAHVNSSSDLSILEFIEDFESLQSQVRAIQLIQLVNLYQKYLTEQSPFNLTSFIPFEVRRPVAEKLGIGSSKPASNGWIHFGVGLFDEVRNVALEKLHSENFLVFTLSPVFIQELLVKHANTLSQLAAVEEEKQMQLRFGGGSTSTTTFVS